MGAAPGEVLCGDKTVIDKMTNLVKMRGGTMYGNWANAAMALHRLEGLETRLRDVVSRSAELFALLNKIPGITITALNAGTNIYQLQLGKEVDTKKMNASLRNTYNIRIPLPPDRNSRSFITVNETMLYRDNNYIVEAFKKAMV